MLNLVVRKVTARLLKVKQTPVTVVSEFIRAFIFVISKIDALTLLQVFCCKQYILGNF
jgi:hypothetical protein